MVLNLMIVKSFSFLPGLVCVKNGLPLLAMAKNKVTKIKIGESSSKAKNATKKSNMGFIIFGYTFIKFLLYYKWHMFYQ
jgi:hypothetical protein